MSDRMSGYLLGELTPDERAAFEAELERDAALRAEVERLAPVVARLEAIEPAAWEQPAAVPPLPALRAEAEPARSAPQLVAALARPAPAPGRGAGRRAAGARRRRRDPAAATATATATVAAGRVVVLAPVEPGDGDAAGTATLASSGSSATVHLENLPPSEPGQFYELWLLNTVDDMVALGSFSVPPSGELDVTVPLPADAGRFGALDLSLEPDDGDPAHSTVSVLRAPLKSS